MKQAEQLYVLVSKEQHYSRKNGGTYWRLEFLDPTTGELLETLVDQLYNNWANWQSILNDARSPGIYTNLKLTTRKTRGGTRVISADSTPALVDRLTSDELALLLEAVLAGETAR